jgi:glycosyltransferase involved in cell wall biosynthesis
VHGTLRVLVVAPTPFFGDRGCHVRIYEEVRGLAARGIEARVVTYPTGRDPDGVSITRARPWLGVEAGTLGPTWGRPLLDLSLLAACRRAVREFKPHLIHGHLHEGIAIGTMLRVCHGLPLVADLQGSLTEELADHRFIPEQGMARELASFAERWLVRRPDRIVTSSSHGAALLRDQGVDASRIVALPDGVDVGVFRPCLPNAALRRQLGLEHRRVVVFLGVLTEYQGVDLLLDAVPAVVRRCPGTHFLVMGYPNEGHYRQQARARGIEQSVTFSGRVPYEEAPRWLNLGDVAVSPKRSLTEANGKLLNYMACGLPVVATDTPVNRELLGDAGVYVMVGDAAGLAERLVDMLSKPEDARALGAALRLRAERVFAWPVLIQRLEALYRSIQPSTKRSGH